ncbi:MAG: amidohydrolase [Spirochaetes bacterium]|nr:amidohydrolase [Spirochaetota bacterium]
MLKQKTAEWVDRNADDLTDMARQIWENPEEVLKETFACELQKEYLKRQGFDITVNDKIPTAFVASFGRGKPVLGLLGEYDALKKLSQAVSAERQPLKEGGHGHACGHNLLGVGCLGAVVAVKELIEKGELAGTVRYYGCPAEELLVGKTLMAREGMFDGLDAALSWHPSPMTMPWAGSLLALYSAEFTFAGKSAHAGSAPHAGRSALDAVELMNVGANYMREHVLDQNRIHYIVTNGGIEPNTVPAEASVWYNVRAPKKTIAQDTFRWLVQIAQGAAMMTQTTLSDVKIISGCYEVLPNQTLVKVLEKNMHETGAPKFTYNDREFAKKISGGYDRGAKEKGLESNFVPLSFMDSFLHEGIEPAHDFGKSLKASSDAGDVSWIAPFAMFGAAAFPLGTSPHTWQATASSGSGIGFHAMHFAAKVLAGALVDLYCDPGILQKAKEEFESATGGKRYVSVFDEKIV